MEGTLGTRLGQLLRHGIAQVRVWRSALAGVSHAMVFWAMIVLTIVTTIVAIEDYGIAHLFYGDFYRVVSLAADLFGIVLIAGCAVAIARRYGERLYQPLARPVDTAIIWGLLTIAITGFLVEGLRIAATGREVNSFERIAFVGWGPGRLVRTALPERTPRVASGPLAAAHDVDHGADRCDPVDKTPTYHFRTPPAGGGPSAQVGQVPAGVD